MTRNEPAASALPLTFSNRTDAQGPTEKSRAATDIKPQSLLASLPRRFGAFKSTSQILQDLWMLIGNFIKFPGIVFQIV